MQSTLRWVFATVEADLCQRMNTSTTGACNFSQHVNPTDVYSVLGACWDLVTIILSTGGYPIESSWILNTSYASSRKLTIHRRKSQRA